MGKVEIKIRKKILTPDNLQQYRNYPALLKKYKRNKQFKRALKIFLYSLALTMFVLALIFLGMWKVMLDKKIESPGQPKKFTYVLSGSLRDTVEYKNFAHLKTDSFYIISYQYDTFQYTTKMRLPVKPEFNDTTFSFNDSTFNQKITYERVVTIQVEGKDYQIIRYLATPGGMDADAFLFYCPDFGLLTVRSRTWPAYRHLIMTGNSKDDRIIRQLNREIENNQEFFRVKNRLK
jgi:hypothetical protein